MERNVRKVLTMETDDLMRLREFRTNMSRDSLSSRYCAFVRTFKIFMNLLSRTSQQELERLYDGVCDYMNDFDFEHHERDTTMDVLRIIKLDLVKRIKWQVTK